MSIRGITGRYVQAAIAIAATVAMWSAAPANAGTFVLHQCGGVKQHKGGFQPAEPHGSSFEVVDKCSDGGSVPALEVSQISNAGEGKRGFWHLRTVDPSLRFAAVSARVKLVGGSGVQARLGAMDVDPTLPVNSSRWGTWIATDGSSDWRNVSRDGLNDIWLKLGLECTNPTCYLRSGSDAQVARGRNFEITIRDTGDPSVVASGPLLADGSLVKGTQSGSVSASDSGAGVEYVETRVNGIAIDKTQNTCRLASGATDSQTPCAGSQFVAIQDDTALAPWQYGSNAVQICVYDFRTAGTANSACTSRTVRVDARADGPTSLTSSVSHWINDKDKFSASVGVPNSVAPLTRLHYRLMGPGGYERTGSKTNGFASISGSELPLLGAPGTYSLRVWFEDSLGNVSEASTARSVELKYDPVKPEPAILDSHNGWIASYDFDPAFEQRWSKPANDDAYPSGLRGYAVSLSPDSRRDPCDGGSTSGCDAEEISHGPLDRTLRLEAQDRADGRYFASAVPVTNADNRGERSQTAVFIDRTDPVVTISGIPSGWSRDPVTVEVNAEDAMSGMEPAQTPLEMPDGPPTTAMRIDDEPVLEAHGDTVQATVDADGVHRISYYARDLAGNRNDGSVELRSGYRFAAPSSATVRIDSTAPKGAFKEPARDDPTLQRIEVRDPMSGVGRVALQLRRVGSDSWYSLASHKSGVEYVTRIDESAWDKGTYEMRAVATDVAGNTAILDRFNDGSLARLELPLREASKATIDAAGTRAGRERAGSRWHKVGYGDRPVYFGRLRDADGDPIAHTRVHVRERFDPGSTRKQRVLAAMTDGQGRYRVSGSAGPSRVTRVQFSGDRRFRPTESSYVRTLVRGAVRLTDYPRQIEAGKPAVFRGQIARGGVKMPGRGKLYEMQLHVPQEGWKTLDQAQHSRPDGSFRFIYRFRPVLRAITFRMRVHVKRDAEQWAYTQAASRTVAVTVRP